MTSNLRKWGISSIPNVRQIRIISWRQAHKKTMRGLDRLQQKLCNQRLPINVRAHIFKTAMLPACYITRNMVYNETWWKEIRGGKERSGKKNVWRHLDRSVKQRRTATWSWSKGRIVRNLRGKMRWTGYVARKSNNGWTYRLTDWVVTESTRSEGSKLGGRTTYKTVWPRWKQEAQMGANGTRDMSADPWRTDRSWNDEVVRWVCIITFAMQRENKAIFHNKRDYANYISTSCDSAVSSIDLNMIRNLREE